MLDLNGVLQRIEAALCSKQPLSIVRVGDGENLILAQNSVWTMEQVLREEWAKRANRGRKGVTLPNLALRDEMADVLKNADIVGILPADDQTIGVEEYLKRPLTDQVFMHFNIHPRCTCHASVNRRLAGSPGFWSMLRAHRILVITSRADELRQVLEAEPYGLHVVHALSFSHYNDMERARNWLIRHPDHFDAALISCGVNAVILAQMVRDLTGKVGIDFGKGRNILLKERF
ncbi:GT-D fold domain-containing glycosyltransferase [Paenibacillus sp. JX-17]|uniref:GT-D fold domain-containing glycosyltransferase n=1 Tax=Paenibacillus lacisoli TaxID=3064525 RepID=A0ABT9CG68_9BACL|nr:GT-D fold domain-containing glycosyltransferase [Paenibacillus sp. JX-17]MDO7907629.1 GT-D fold domain-containing glycosyltransferase [Paenibacillus sp. JX-17]